MAAETITVAAEIDSRGATLGAARFGSALSTMRAGVVGMLGSLGSLQGILASVASVAAAKKVVEAADNYLLLKARLSLVTAEGASVEGLLGRLAERAEAARTPTASLTEIYTKNANALKDMGRSADEGIRLAETLAKVTTISGVSASSTSAAMHQLSQAIASGRFQGDEFRSVAENMPEVMRILQRETGKTAAELRKLASEGKLTGEVLVNSLLNASQEVDKKFATMPQTAGQAFSLLQDQAARTFGSVAESSKLSEAWADAFNNIRDAMASDSFKGAAKNVTDLLADVGRGFSALVPAMNESAAQYKSWLQAISETSAYQTVSSAISNLTSTIWSHVQGVVTGAAQISASLGRLASESDVGRRAAQLRMIAADEQDERERIAGLKELTSAAAPAQQKKLPIKFGAGEEDKLALRRAENIKKRLTENLELERLNQQLILARAEGEETVVHAVENQLAIRTKITAESRKIAPELAREYEAQILIGQELRRQEEQRQKIAMLGEEMGRVITSSFVSMAKQGEKFSDTLKKIAAQLIEIAAQKTILDPLVGQLGKSLATATGGTDIGGFLAGGLKLFGFADGAVFNSPVAMSSAGGFRGVMAEAGPEAVMPLQRGPGGKLGVAVTGGSQNAGNVVNVSFNVAGDATEATLAKMREMAERVFAQGAPKVIRQSVSAVRDRNISDPSYLRR